jgi:hypothetical protein
MPRKNPALPVLDLTAHLYIVCPLLKSSALIAWVFSATLALVSTAHNAKKTRLTVLHALKETAALTALALTAPL